MKRAEFLKSLIVAPVAISQIDFSTPVVEEFPKLGEITFVGFDKIWDDDVSKIFSGMKQSWYFPKHPSNQNMDAQNLKDWIKVEEGMFETKLFPND